MPWTRCSRCWTGPVRGGPCPRTIPWWDFSGPPAAASPPSSTPSAARKSRRRPCGGPPPPNRWRASGAPRAARRCWTGWRSGNRHHAAPVAGFADDGTGLILLDLPDFDSTRAANREIVQRMVGLVDVLVWVLDPQKYADAAVHNDFLAPLAVPRRRDAGGAEPGRPAPGAGCAARPGVAQGHPGAATGWARCRSSAPPPSLGAGVDKVRAAIRQVAAQRRGPCPSGSAADVTQGVGRGWRRHRADGEAAGVTAASKARLAEELAVAANVPLVVDAVVRVLPARGDPAHRLAGDPLAGPLPARSAAPAEPAPRGRQTRAEPDLAAARRCPGAGPDAMPPSGNLPTRPSDGAPGPWRAVIRGAARRGQGPAAGRSGPGDRLHGPDGRPEVLVVGAFNVVQWLALLTAAGRLRLARRAGGAGLPAAARAGGPAGAGLAGAHRDDRRRRCCWGSSWP